MSFPQFVPVTLGETSQTTTVNVIKAFNNIVKQLLNIFTYVFKKVQLDSVLLQNIQLNIGTNQVPHTLGRTLTGWSITRQRGYSMFYDAQDDNTNPNTYLALVSSQVVTVDIIVF